VVDNIVGTTVQNFSQEIVQEFKSESRTTIVDGASATAQVNIVTRSGSNSFHGNGFYYDRHFAVCGLSRLNRLEGDLTLPLHCGYAGFL